LDSLFYTALVYTLGPKIEAARIPVSDGVAIAHRFLRNRRGDMWTEGGTWADFQQRSRELVSAKGVEVVLKADIADFYQKIYHHPLENRLRAAGVRNGYIKTLLRVLNEWNGNVSYGIPIGQAASRLLAELVLDDVDRALIGEGYSHCRWTDDFRIFCKSERESNRAMAFLTRVLFENHGLGLQHSKTVLLSDVDFMAEVERAETVKLEVNRRTHTPFVDEDDLFGDEDEDETTDDEEWGDDDDEEFGDLDDLPKVSLAPTSFDYLPIDVREVVERFEASKVVTQLMDRYGSMYGAYRLPDPGLLRVLLAKLIQNRDAGAAKAVVAHLGDVGPILPDSVKYLDAIRDKLSDEFRHETGETCLHLLVDSDISDFEFSVMWVLALFSSSTAFDHEGVLPQLYNDHTLPTARRKITLALGVAGNDAWFRVRRNDFAALSPWERRAFLFGSRCMERDERKHWYDSVKKSLDILDGAVVSYAQGRLVNRALTSA
jgi:hypothetical protein